MCSKEVEGSNNNSNDFHHRNQSSNAYSNKCIINAPMYTPMKCPRKIYCPYLDAKIVRYQKQLFYG